MDFVRENAVNWEGITGDDLRGPHVKTDEQVVRKSVHGFFLTPLGEGKPGIGMG